MNSMSQPEIPRSEFAEQIRAASAQIKGLTALHAELMATMQKIQAVLLFTTHPELADLDRELDNCYPDVGEQL